VGQNSAASPAVARWIAKRLPTLLRRRGVEAAYVFGSWARGDADRLSDIDLIIVARSRRPFVDRFRDFPEILRAPAGIELLVYTPEEFTALRRTNRFVRHVLREARRVA
jgi:predicted nucleotidyltransferase